MTAGGPTVVALVPDLMDRSRVVAAVPHARFVSDVAALAKALVGTGREAVALVDLGREDVVAAIEALASGGARVVGFGSHVDTDLLDRARAAGAEVHPRSRLFRSLPAILAGDARPAAGPAIDGTTGPTTDPTTEGEP